MALKHKAVFQSFTLLISAPAVTFIRGTQRFTSLNILSEILNRLGNSDLVVNKIYSFLLQNVNSK